ncbi:NACHT and WD repeat domain-containing protein 2-like isoform X2 [Phycodurus eques]|uniref:NACHT and WD repeat domain-containing protein 2-like isoform X2 n=1 Tax=Phycodurus eques TaxID=693459 RepID=UPI002ACD8A2C|nr:NACHT and WD repeat domain-containing protein 2-like isoform X2 [Phycodurus eques]
MDQAASNCRLRSTCVKLYLCSNPTDSVVERRALREVVFPKLREHCRHKLGVDFRVIDPHESINPSRWPDENTRNELIKNCRESSAGPFLLALIGPEYGRASLPAQVEVSHFHLLLQQIQQAGLSTKELERVYHRDENTVPPTFCLRASCLPQENHMEDLVKMFEAAVSLCVHKNLLTEAKGLTFNRSVLDGDLRFGLNNCPRHDAVRRCLAYVHKVTNLKVEQEGTVPNSARVRSSSSEADLLSDLIDNFLKGLIDSSQLEAYTTATNCDRRRGYTTARRRAYADLLCHQVYSDLVRLTDNIAESGQIGSGYLSDALAREQVQQEELCAILSGFYVITRPEMEEIRAYVQQSDQRRPLVLTGGPCAGKRVLLAHCAHQMRSWLRDTDPAVITFFTDLPHLPSAERLLSSLCYQILRSYDRSSSSQDLNAGHRRGVTELRNAESSVAHLNPRTVFRAIKKPDISLYEVKEYLCFLLSLLPSSKKPLVLILDGVDQMGRNFAVQIIESLPSPLPPGVKIILGISSKHTHLMQVIKLHYPECSAPGFVSEGVKKQLGYVHVLLGSADRKQCLKVLMSLLSNSRRRVTSGQLALLNQALTSCCFTLYVRLLHCHTSFWCSDSEVSESHLPDGVHSSVAALLDHLEHKYSSPVVAHALSYLAISSVGLTEAELADLLSRAHANQITQVDVERLLLELKGFLIRRTVTGCQVFTWVSRHFRLVVAKTYLDTREARRKIHSEMADYFISRWNACLETSCLDEGSAQTSAYVEERPPLIDAVNARKAVELMYHLQESNSLELRWKVLTSWRFHHVLVKAGLLRDLVAMLRQEQGSWDNLRECSLLASILASSSCFLQSSPIELPTLMEASLLPYLEVFPALRFYVDEIRWERGIRGCGLAVLLPPSPDTVPLLRHLQRDGGPTQLTVTAAGTRCGTITEIMRDGSAWLWNGSDFGMVRLSPNCEQGEIKFAGVKSSHRFMLFATLCNKLFLCDVTAPEIFVEVKASHTPNMFEGFVAFDRQLCVWWKQDSIVGLFDASNTSVTNLKCPSYVTCVAFSSLGSHIYCGQEEGTVSIFDIDSCSLLCSCSNSNRCAIVSIILCKDKEEMACVARSGALKLWKVPAKTQTPRFVKEASAGSEFNDMLNTDYLYEFSSFLVCHCKQVTVWDTCEWEKSDYFWAPQGQAFAQVVFSQDGHHLVALLEDSPLVLVWRLSTAQCVLSLNANNLPHTLLKTTSHIVCVTDNGCLLAWDAEMVYIAGEAPKMECGVKDVTVEQTGQWFYTADGTDTVWSWSFQTGLPHANFLHDNPVKKIRLSKDDLTLVTLSGEDIYIWQTETGQNSLRIGGSRATDVLITPNCKFGVSICEQGLSRVWKMAHGGVVCGIHLYLCDAQVSPESTFLIGLHGGDLLAASLWSGTISRSFSRAKSSEDVVAFHTLSQHTDFVVVMVASGGIYTWKMSDETVCRHFQLPGTLYCQPQNFQMTSNGSFALLSIDNEAITLLDVSRVRLCSFKAGGSVMKACLDETGRYMAYISQRTSQERQRCTCSQHAHPTLTVVQLSDGEKIGRVFLCKDPLTLLVHGQQCVFVGFRDGSVGVYSISGPLIGGEDAGRCVKNLGGQLRGCCWNAGPLRWFPLKTPNITWP